MQKFKVVVLKGGKHFTFIVTANDENQVKDKIHKDGYSILNLENITEDIDNNSTQGHKFFFEAEKQGEKKEGKVIGDDIFKVYIKLKRNLGYNVIKLYSESDKNATEEEKLEIIKELEEEYNIYLSARKNPKKSQIKKEINTEKKGFDNFYLKKDLEETYKLIEFILDKLNNIINEKEIKNIKNIDKVRLKNIYNSIIKVKKTTNITKLREIGELALLKIGNLEKNQLEIKKEDSIKKLLKETNSLLRKIGSKQQIIENQYDLGFIFKNKLKEFTNLIKENFKKEKKKEKLDKTSYNYIKNELLLKKYKEKLKLNTRSFFKNVFNSKKREDYFLRRNVIKQNILLLKAKKKGIKFSYTKIKNKYNTGLKMLLKSFKNIRVFLLYLIIVYTFSFLILLNIYFYIKKLNLPIYIEYFNYKGIFYFIILMFSYLFLFLSRNMITIILNTIILLFIIIVGIVNF